MHALFIVLLAGLAINGANARKEGHPIESGSDFKKAVVHSYHNPKPLDYSKLNN